MIDYTLKFPDQATANEVLFEKFPLKLDEDLNVVETYDVPRFPGMSIDTIGVIYKPTGEMLLGEDGEYPAMAPIEGWHVNVRGPEAPELESYAVEVKTPARIWA